MTGTNKEHTHQKGSYITYRHTSHNLKCEHQEIKHPCLYLTVFLIATKK